MVRKRMVKRRPFVAWLDHRAELRTTSIKVPGSGGGYNADTGDGEAYANGRIRVIRGGQWIGWWQFSPDCGEA